MPKTAWKLEDAKARFSEVVRLAGVAGPQHVTVRGKEAAVVLSARDYARLAPIEPREPLTAFLSALELGDLALHREVDRGREVGL